MDRARLAIVGGFLGAGKTTALLALARDLHRDGKRVALITNDQAPDLVDTEMVRVRGFRVEEVAGACFCCKFDDLARAADRLLTEERPEVLLAEPVGSCTDLAATVVAPLRKLYGDRYSVAPYSVLVDPARARSIVIERGDSGFSPKVAYIFHKQMEEADLICLNKSDLLSPRDRDLLLGALAAEFPRARVISTSGLTGDGLPAWRSLLEEDVPAGRNIAEVDYDTYAEGEAELGWLNLTLEVEASSPFRTDLLARDVVQRMGDLLSARKEEAAHIKLILGTPGGSVTANWVGGGTPARVQGPSEVSASRGRLILNARVHTDPLVLRSVAQDALAQALAAHGARGSLEESTQFRPGRPVPIHRFAAGEI